MQNLCPCGESRDTLRDMAEWTRRYHFIHGEPREGGGSGELFEDAGLTSCVKGFEVQDHPWDNLTEHRHTFRRQVLFAVAAAGFCCMSWFFAGDGGVAVSFAPALLGVLLSNLAWSCCGLWPALVAVGGILTALLSHSGAVEGPFAENLGAALLAGAVGKSFHVLRAWKRQRVNRAVADPAVEALKANPAELFTTMLGAVAAVAYMLVIVLHEQTPKLPLGNGRLAVFFFTLFFALMTMYCLCHVFLQVEVWVLSKKKAPSAQQAAAVRNPLL